MKHFIRYTATVIFFYFIYVIPASSQTWRWAQKSYCPVTESGDIGAGMGSVATDLSGNIYAVGGWNGDSVIVGSFILTNPIHYMYYKGGTFIVKYDSVGTMLWCRSFIGHCDGSVLTTDTWGNIYATGGYIDTISIGGHWLTDTGWYANSPNSFIVKLDPSGNVIWLRHIISAGGCNSTSITTDTKGHIYIAGSYDAPKMMFDSITLLNDFSLIAGSSNGFIAKYDSAGRALWANNAGGDGYDGAESVAVDPLGNVYISGAFGSDVAHFNSLTLTLSGSSQVNIFLVKYDSSGNALWARNADGGGQYGQEPLVADAEGGIYIAGIFVNPTITFGSTTLDHSAGDSTFLVKYDTAGNVVWAKGSGAYSSYLSLCTDDTGNIFLASTFTDRTINLDGTTFTNSGPPHTNDMFIIKYTPAGNFDWIVNASGPSNEMVNAITADVFGNIYVAGVFEGYYIIFGSTTLEHPDTSVLYGRSDGFLAKLNATYNPYLNVPVNVGGKDVVIYPNPTIDRVNIAATDNITSIDISNLLGQVVYTSQFNSEKTTIDISDLSPGVYLIAITTFDGQRLVREIVKR